MNMGTRAQQANASRVEAYLWRAYALGGYRYGLGDGIAAIVAAIKEGFLNKAKNDAEQGYRVDKTYLGYITTYAYFCFLGKIPGYMPLSGYGFQSARFKRALELYYEYRSHMPRDRYVKSFHWDILAPYTAEFLIATVDVLDLEGEKKADLLNDARWYCQLGAKGNRPVYRTWSIAMLNEKSNWK
jgi:hypothetical protein